MFKENENIKIWQRLVSSSTGAIVTSIIVTPLDVIKIRMQAQSKPISSGDCFIYCNGLMDHLCQYVNGNNKQFSNAQWYKKPLKFTNTFDALQKVVKTEGVLSLWSGLSPTLILAVPQVVIYYTLNDWLKYATGYENYKLATSQHSLSVDHINFNQKDLLPPLCGTIARFVAQTTIAPLELLRTKMQSKKLSYFEIKNITSSAIQQGGFSVLWRGLGPTMWRDLPYSIALWSIYDYLKRRHLINRDCCIEEYFVPYNLIILYSACGAVVAGIISHPFDVTKTHRQIELGNAILHNTKITSSTWKYLRTLRKTNGFSSLFSGFNPRILRVVIATTTMITIFETIKKAFIKFNTENH
uniref:Slc25a-35 n=1 Tax=Schmidtea mediterranea TaxID=79327 RepID=A0A0H3YKC7_SCHMD|nr:slc25a-35 [Schmidtea mediterranea]